MPPQVKTYTDHGNGIRQAGSSHYSKLSPGREYSDNDMELQASQSQDCEPTPPLQRQGSKSNFFLPSMDANNGDDSPRHIKMYPRHSPYPKHRQMDGSGRNYTPDTLSPEQLPMITASQQSVQNQQQQQQQQRSVISSATPTMQQRIKALGIATPIAISSPIRRSNPGTPTQPRRPDFIQVQMMNQPPNTNYYELHHPQQQQQSGGVNYMPQTSQAAQMYHNQMQGNYDPNVSYHPQAVQNYQGDPRRFLSEGELLRQNNELSYARTNNTSDNIRELAGSPQKGVYVWKNTSPNNYNPNDFPPPQNSVANMIRQQMTGNSIPPVLQRFASQVSHSSSVDSDQGQPTSVYHPALRGGVQVFPPAAAAPSPQIKRKTQNSRPMSFVRALEMSDSIEMATSVSSGNGNSGNNTQNSQQQSGGNTFI